MQKTITIGTCECPMLSNAATPLYYKNTFFEDLIAHFQGDESTDEHIEVVMKLAYIMAMQAATPTKKIRQVLSEDAFYEWLSRFEWLDIANAAEAITDLYLAQTGATSTPKNVEAEEKES